MPRENGKLKSFFLKIMSSINLIRKILFEVCYVSQSEIINVTNANNSVFTDRCSYPSTMHMHSLRSQVINRQECLTEIFINNNFINKFQIP